MLIDRLIEAARVALIETDGAEGDEDGAYSELSSAAVRAVLATLEAEGFKPVPEGATAEMVASCTEINWESEDDAGTIHNVWNSMLAASPKLEEVP